MNLSPWHAVMMLDKAALRLKQDQPLPDSVTKIAHYTSEYEKFITDLWNKAKGHPTRANINDFIDAMVSASDEVWEKFYLDLLDLEELLPIHRNQMEASLDKHKYYLQNSLLPDLLKEAGKGSDAFNKFDYRVIFLYSGALWSAGNLATVMFDGLTFRDLGDIFIFAGPNDSETCTGDRGCDQYAGKAFTVAEILAQDIVPGHMQCFTNCRHMLVPVLSPLDGVGDLGEAVTNL